MKIFIEILWRFRSMKIWKLTSYFCSFFKDFIKIGQIITLIVNLGSTYTISAVQSIERQFQIPSKLSGFLLSAHEISYIPSIIFGKLVVWVLVVFDVLYLTTQINSKFSFVLWLKRQQSEMDSRRCSK